MSDDRDKSSPGYQRAITFRFDAQMEARLNSYRRKRRDDQQLGEFEVFSFQLAITELVDMALESLGYRREWTEVPQKEALMPLPPPPPPPPDPEE